MLSLLTRYIFPPQKQARRFALTLLHFVHAHIKDVLNFPPLMIEIRFLPPGLMVLLLVVPMLMGVLGSWTAVKE